ncbi:unnamed protein product [Schistosoma haematobium]|nr:unnamed protein product [Schistosoma haematobium]
MGSISIQLVAESVQAIVRMSQYNQEAPNVNDLALGIMASVIVTKLILWIICFKFGGGMAIDALKTDQRNDILTNAASILFSGFAGRLRETWKTHPIEVFRKRLSSNIRTTKTTSKSVMEFYRRQDEHIRELEKIASTTEAETSDVEVTSNHHSIRRQTRINTMIIGVVFCANVVLLLGKAVASALSGSLAIISSLLDSCVDLASGGIMWFAARQMRKRKPYKYPEGRTRLEPLAVIVLSVFMGSISIQLVAESVQAIVRMSQYNQEAPNVNDLALGIMASVIVTKLILWIICFKFGGGMAIDALKTDQRNDILTNAASILFSGFAGRLQDPNPTENTPSAPPTGSKRRKQILPSRADISTDSHCVVQSEHEKARSCHHKSKHRHRNKHSQCERIEKCGYDVSSSCTVPNSNDGHELSSVIVKLLPVKITSIEEFQSGTSTVPGMHQIHCQPSRVNQENKNIVKDLHSIKQF